jgi:hypothetical protein
MASTGGGDWAVAQGQPIIARWGVEDPAAFAGSPEAMERFFYDVARILHRGVQLLTSLPLEKLRRLKVEKLTRDIGKDHAVKVEKAAGDEPRRVRSSDRGFRKTDNPPFPQSLVSQAIRSAERSWMSRALPSFRQRSSKRGQF